eukprot:TRINITY_DN499_c0_g1_i7.p2 TRINITY_DN499_c0_g1~~TRINITY_DN499_c0_g1_i7.p2  ORF type:complete len:153 (+),score=19.38 TRINITY_DN499_c0_g1_i7:138-596(+)
MCIRDSYKAQAWGLQTDILIESDQSVQPQALVQSVASKISANLIENIVLSPAQFTQDSATSCDYLSYLKLYFQQVWPNKNVVVFSNRAEWTSKLNTCTKLTNMKLCYEDFDEMPDFSDWPQQQFGGWTSAYEKAYSSWNALCSVSVSLIYRQ